MDTRSFMLGVMMGGGGGVTTEEGDFSVTGGYSSIPVQMVDYDVLVAYKTAPLGSTSNLIIGHVETPLWSLDIVATINGTSYSIPTISGTMVRKQLNGKGNPANGTWHYIAIKFNS